MRRGPGLLRAGLPLAVLLVVLVALPAGAHPFIEGGSAPVDSLADLRLHIAHGCESGEGEHGEGGAATTEVALEVHADMRIVDVPEIEGYEVGLEHDEQGRIEVVTWTATDGGVPAPDLPFSAVLTGAPGDELFLRVFQACDDFTYRWVGTPDEPADDPAIGLELTEADPDNPPPEIDTPADDTDATPDDGSTGTDDAGADPDAADAPDDDGPEADGTDPDAAAAEDTDAGDDTDGNADGVGEQAAEDGRDAADGGGLTWPLVALGVVVVVAVVVLATRGRRGGRASA